MHNETHNNAVLNPPHESPLRQRGFAGWLMQASRALLSNTRAADTKQMRVVETLTLGPKKQLVLVTCSGQRFLIGTGAESVQTIVAIHPASSVGDAQ